MPKVNLEPEEFGDFVAIFLLDSLVNPEVLINNDNYRDFAGKLKAKGMKSALVKYYFEVPSEMRVKYKRLKDVLITGEDQGVINIMKKGKEIKKKREKEARRGEGVVKKVKRVVRKVTKKLTGKDIGESELTALVEQIIIELEEDNG